MLSNQLSAALKTVFTQELAVLCEFLEELAAYSVQGSGLKVDILHCGTERKRYFETGLHVLLNCIKMGC